MRKLFLVLSLLTVVTIAVVAQYWPPVLWSLVLVLPLFAVRASRSDSNLECLPKSRLD